MQNCLACGYLQEIPLNSRVNFLVTKFSDIFNVVVPFFNKYPLQGSKNLDFQDFCLIVKLMSEKKHLTLEGLEIIKQIKSGMNTGRNKLKSDNSATSFKDI